MRFGKLPESGWSDKRDIGNPPRGKDARYRVVDRRARPVSRVASVIAKCMIIGALIAVIVSILGIAGVIK